MEQAPAPSPRLPAEPAEPAKASRPRPAAVASSYTLPSPDLLQVPKERSLAQHEQEKQQTAKAIEDGFAAFNVEAARSVLNLPADAEPVIFTPLGYPADLPGPKIRKPLKDLVRYEHW